MNLNSSVEAVSTAEASGPIRSAQIGQTLPELGSARGAFTLPEGWDAPLSDVDVEELFAH